MVDSVVASPDSTANFGGDSSSAEQAVAVVPSVENEAGALVDGVPIASDDE